MIPQVCVSLIERAARGVIGEEIPHRDNTQKFRSSDGSNQLFTDRNGIDGRENLCGVPFEVADHSDMVGPQLDDDFGCQIEPNLHLVDNVANNKEDEEPFETKRRARRVHRCSSTTVDIVGTYEVRPNVTPADSENATMWVIPGAESYSFGFEEIDWAFCNAAALRMEGENVKYDNITSGLFDGQLYVEVKSVRGFQRCMHPVIAVDGTHLKGRFGGTILVATAQYENEQVYPIAFGYSDSENNLSWEWFLDSLKGVIGHIDDLHFYENIKKIYHRKDVVAIMDKAAQAYTELQYNQHMEELRNLHPNAYDYVIDAGPYKCSRIHCPDRRYMVMTTNVAECINSCLKFARQLPMLTLAEFIRNMLQRWFHDRHRAAQSMGHQLTDAAHLVILKRMDKCNFMTINPVDWNIFSVKRSEKQWTVDLARKTCTCNKF
ncbi:hypothetical protein Ddye_029569 [Dipteronia dyeriana]|uniref:MULE transposase domain-containing protein n=1 Tax=Dipteronia dyeriana TaxID=168575 RepID=A0AAD9TET9_9ROSI|nr:hypothetical protein Ddye_029569 [Dipteronia dyeriana]